jgi:AbrB family looped-hinge helix DNA binding protein
MDIIDNLHHNEPIRVRIAAGGRIVIPAEIRQSLGVREGDELLIIRERDGIRITTVLQTAKEVQAFFEQFKKPGESVVDEFLAERREEA